MLVNLISSQEELNSSQRFPTEDACIYIGPNLNWAGQAPCTICKFGLYMCLCIFHIPLFPCSSGSIPLNCVHSKHMRISWDFFRNCAISTEIHGLFNYELTFILSGQLGNYIRSLQGPTNRYIHIFFFTITHNTPVFYLTFFNKTRTVNILELSQYFSTFVLSEIFLSLVIGPNNCTVSPTDGYKP